VTGYVFINYARVDQAYVARLGGHLRGAGVPVWIDDELVTGDRWASVIRARIDGCAAMVVVASGEDGWSGSGSPAAPPAG